MNTDNCLITMAVWDTLENNRTLFTQRTLESLGDTINPAKDRLVIVDNNSCQATKDLYRDYTFIFDVIYLSENIGQARAINTAWEKHRRSDDLCIKIDNDVVIKHPGWIEDMAYVLEKDPTIGIIALKRKNAWEHPDHDSPDWRSRLEMLPHKEGERWMTIEVCNSIVGTCEAFNPKFLARIGYLYQVGSLWGFIDPILAMSARTLGYRVAFLPHVEIDYLDDPPVSEKYRAWKQQIFRDFLPPFDKEMGRIKTTGQVHHGPKDP